MTEGATKHDIQVLYQLDAGIRSSQDISDISDMEVKEVKEAVRHLKELGLIKKDKKKVMVTEKGKEAIKTHKKWALGL
jgi:predicted methyltransferase